MNHYLVCWYNNGQSEIVDLKKNGLDNTDIPIFVERLNSDILFKIKYKKITCKCNYNCLYSLKTTNNSI